MACFQFSGQYMTSMNKSKTDQNQYHIDYATFRMVATVIVENWQVNL
jgi:hypothetical protein